MRFNNLQDWLDWQSTLHPQAIELGLDRVRTVWERLGADLGRPLVITVAGTNGKGSSVALLESILRAAGFKVGCYTSPHILRYNERIRVDGAEVDDARLMAAFDRVDQARGDTRLTYFEFGTLAALSIFAEENPDAVVLEVGLGGRLDAVNIIDPDGSLITTIDLDHTEWLGTTREEIAREKAGILRAGRPAVFGGENPPDSLLAVAAELGVPLKLAGRDFLESKSAAFGGAPKAALLDSSWSWQAGDARLDDLPPPALSGSFQYRNAAAVLTLLHMLRERLPVAREAIEAGLRSVSLAGRFQPLPGDPRVILDVAHNPEAARSLAENLRDHPVEGRTLAVFAMLGDKAIREVIEALFAEVDHWYPGGLEGPRTLPAAALVTELKKARVGVHRITPFPTVAGALRAALRDLEEGDRVVVFGSFLTVAAAVESLTPPA